MNIITNIWTVFFNNVLSQPAIFIGLIVVLGYILLKRKWYEIGAGFIRTVVGYMMLQSGAGLLKGTVDPLLNGIQQKWQISAVVIDPNFGLTAANSALESIGVTTSFAMVTLLVAFVWNIILVFFRKVTKVRTLFTTGHIMVKQSTVATWIIFFLLPNFRNMTGIILVGLLCGTYWSVFSNLTVEATQEHRRSRFCHWSSADAGRMVRISLWRHLQEQEKRWRKERVEAGRRNEGAGRLCSIYNSDYASVLRFHYGNSWTGFTS